MNSVFVYAHGTWWWVEVIVVAGRRKSVWTQLEGGI